MEIIKFFVKIIFTFIIVTYIISKDSLVNALPCYKNFQDADIISAKIKLGYWKNSTHIKEYNYLWYEEGFSASLGINPLYALNFLKNIYLNLQTDLTFKSDIQNNNILLLLEYNFPIKLHTPSFIPNFILFGSVGGGVNFWKANNINTSPIIIDKFNNIYLISYGVMIKPSQLKDTNYSFYIENKNIYSQYAICENNNKIYRQYKNTFVTIGVCYKITYLINKGNI